LRDFHPAVAEDIDPPGQCKHGAASA